VKPIAIIAISVACSVVAVLAVQFLISGEDIGESIGNIVPFDCAKAWDAFTTSLRITDNNAFNKLSEKEQQEIRKHNAILRDGYHHNWCTIDREEWRDRAVDPMGYLTKTDKGTGYLGWAEAESDEIEYNTKWPDGSYIKMAYP